MQMLSKLASYTSAMEKNVRNRMKKSERFYIYPATTAQLGVLQPYTPAALDHVCLKRAKNVFDPIDRGPGSTSDGASGPSSQ